MRNLRCGKKFIATLSTELRYNYSVALFIRRMRDNLSHSATKSGASGNEAGLPRRHRNYSSPANIREVSQIEICIRHDGPMMFHAFRGGGRCSSLTE